MPAMIGRRELMAALGSAAIAWPVVAKRLDLLRQLISTAATIALLTNPANPYSQAERREVEAAARSLGLELHVANAKHQDEIDDLFPDLIARGVRAIMIGGDAYFLFSAAKSQLWPPSMPSPPLLNGASTRRPAA
jgi:putative tryptophan/tyrosine transport system substrate-binding protein